MIWVQGSKTVGSILETGEPLLDIGAASKCKAHDLDPVLVDRDPMKAPAPHIGATSRDCPQTYVQKRLKLAAHCMYIQSHMVHGTQPKRYL